MLFRSSQLSDDMEHLKRMQHQQQANVMELGSRVEDVKKEADYVGTKADLASRTQQASQTLEMERRIAEAQKRQQEELDAKLREQTTYMNDVVRQLRMALEDFRAAADAKLDQIKMLEATLHEERKERQELQRYVQDVEASLMPGAYSDAAIQDMQDITLERDDLGLPVIPPSQESLPVSPVHHHQDRMQKPPCRKPGVLM